MSCGIVTGGNEYLLVREREGGWKGEREGRERGRVEGREREEEREREGSCQVRSYKYG